MNLAGRAAPLSPDQRRESLIDCTLPLLREYGDAVTTRQIAHACGVAEGTNFRAFPDKDSLISATLDKALDQSELLAEIAAINVALDLESRLRAAAAILHDWFTEVFSLLVAMRLSQKPRPAMTAANHEARHAELIDALAGLIRPDEHLLRRSAVEVAHLLRGLIFSGAHPQISAHAPLGPDEVVSILLDGVRTAETTARTARC